MFIHTEIHTHIYVCVYFSSFKALSQTVTIFNMQKPFYSMNVSTRGGCCIPNTAWVPLFPFSCTCSVAHEALCAVQLLGLMHQYFLLHLKPPMLELFFSISWKTQLTNAAYFHISTLK